LYKLLFTLTCIIRYQIWMSNDLEMCKKAFCPKNRDEGGAGIGGAGIEEAWSDWKLRRCEFNPPSSTELIPNTPAGDSSRTVDEARGNPKRGEQIPKRMLFPTAMRASSLRDVKSSDIYRKEYDKWYVKVTSSLRQSKKK
jgi:hypothetical protein